MLRPVALALALTITTTGIASARLAIPKAFDKPTSVQFTVSAAELGGPTPPAPPSGLRMTADTEVYLDGESSSFAAVPATATVTRMVVGGDGQSVTLIEFSTAK